MLQETMEMSNPNLDARKNNLSEIDNHNEFDSFIPRGRNLRFDDFSDYGKSEFS